MEQAISMKSHHLITAQGAGGTMSYQVLLGCYTNQNINTEAKPAEGIYLLTITEEGRLAKEPELLAEQSSPTYFYLKQSGDILYAVSEPGEPFRGEIHAYKVHKEEGVSLERISEIKAAGRGLCHVAMDPCEKNVVVISYPDATVQSYPTNPDGSIQPMFCLRKHVGSGPNLKRQEAAHAHSANFTPDGKYMYVCDLGTDMIYAYTVDPDSAKIHRAYGMNITAPAGSGPRHMVFSPDGQYAYVACELDNEVLTLKKEGEGYVVVDRTDALNPDFDIPTNYPSAIRMTKDGRGVYMSNRGEDTIAFYERDTSNGHIRMKTSHSTMGWYPRDFILTEDERLLIAVNQLSDNIVIYRIKDDGTLEQTDVQTIVQKPVALAEV